MKTQIHSNGNREVQAGKIKSVEVSKNRNGLGRITLLDNSEYTHTKEIFSKCEPSEINYYVVSETGEPSIVPKDEFEKDYSLKSGTEYIDKSSYPNSTSVNVLMSDLKKYDQSKTPTAPESLKPYDELDLHFLASMWEREYSRSVVFKDSLVSIDNATK